MKISTLIENIKWRANVNSLTQIIIKTQYLMLDTI